MKILLVEDNRADARIFEILLGQVDGADSYGMDCVNTLESAIRYLSNGAAEKCDVVFTDLGLPDSFGIDTLKDIHAAASGIPVVVLTGEEDNEKIPEFFENGAADFLSKNSLDETVLARKIAEVLPSPA